MSSGLPDKIYLKIGEVSSLVDLPASVLRFWETEFETLKPKKSPTGQRLYTRKDIEQVEEIKRLLYAEKLTIEGARKRLTRRMKVKESALPAEAMGTLLQELREELLSIRAMLQ